MERNETWLKTQVERQAMLAILYKCGRGFQLRN